MGTSGESGVAGALRYVRMVEAPLEMAGAPLRLVSADGRAMLGLRRPSRRPSHLSPSICGDRQTAERERKLRIPLLGSGIRAENLLLLFTLLSVVAGTAIGLHLNPILGHRQHYMTERQRMYLKFPGEMFMRMLKMVIVPMVIASNISSIAAMNSRAARLLTSLSLIYYVATTAMAVSLGLAAVSLIQPGLSNVSTADIGARPAATLPNNGSVRLIDSVLDLLRNMIPQNVVAATFQKTQTKFVASQTRVAAAEYKAASKANLEAASQRAEAGVLSNSTEEWMTDWINGTGEAAVTDIEKKMMAYSRGTNILGLITFSMLFGWAVHSLGPDAAVLADLFHAVRRVCVYLVSVIIWFSPIGIMCLIAEEIAKTKDLGTNLQQLSKYVATVMSTLFVHGCIVLPGLLWFIAKRNPFQYAYNMLQALMCAMGTASSTATLPCTIRCLEGRNQIDPRVTRFMLPLGTSINMDGTALYQAIAVVYIAQVTGRTLDFGELVLVGMTSALASMAAASMPSAGMITMVMVLTAVDLPDDRIILLWPVDWFLDRFRTMVNVFSDSVGAAVVSSLCENKLSEGDSEKEALEGTLGAEEMVLELPGGLSDVDLDLEAAAQRDPSRVGRGVCSARECVRGGVPLGAWELDAPLVSPPLNASQRMPLLAKRNGDLASHLPSRDSLRRSQRSRSPSDDPRDRERDVRDSDSPACVYVVDEETIVLKF